MTKKEESIYESEQDEKESKKIADDWEKYNS